MAKREPLSLGILNVLMNADGYLTGRQICERVGCERKTVYAAIATLETNGFHIDVIRKEGSKTKMYKYMGLYGL